MAIPSIETVEAACKYFAKRARKETGGIWVQDVYDSVKVTKVYDDSEGSRTVEFVLATPQKFDNGMGMVHGGASSTFCAMFTTLCLAGDDNMFTHKTPTKAELENFYNSIGYTRALDVQILQAVPLNSEIFVRCQIVSRTKSNAFLSATIYSKTGRLLAKGAHDMIRRSYEPTKSDDPQHFHANFHLAKL